MRRALGLAAVVWLIPLWIVPIPPMLDYPQQVAMAAILRWLGDPARGFQAVYEPALGRPQGLFEILTAGLAWLLPIETAGRLVVSLSLAAVVPATLALCRRTGRPDWYALLALAFLYNHAFYWGFVDNLLAYPLVLGGLALADRLFERPFGVGSWLLLAVWTLIFYGAHLQFLLVFAGATAWLALVRRPHLGRLALQLSLLLPGLALGAGVLGWAHLHAAEVMTPFQQRLQEVPTITYNTHMKVDQIPGLLFGSWADGTHWLLALLLYGVVLLLAVPSLRKPPEVVEPRDSVLFRTRFLSLAGWVALLYFLVPEFSRGYLVSGRLVSLAALLAVPALPRPPARRERIALALTGALLAVLLARTTAGFLGFAAEAAGLREVLEAAEPGQTLAGLIYDPVPSAWNTPPVFQHAAAYYQVYRGGRVLLSFAQFFNSPVRFRAGENREEEILVKWDGLSPWRFDLARDGGRFRYFLVRGGREHLVYAFRTRLRGARVVTAGRWSLVELSPIRHADRSQSGR
jgi:hypothetical protein